MKYKIYNSLTLMISCLLSILAAEFFLRFFFPQSLYCFEKGLFLPNRDYGYALTPHVTKTHRQPDYTYTIRANTEGFRGHDPDYKAPKRILILGDSYGMGQGVSEDKTMCYLAHQHFISSGQSLDIFNTSVSGYAGINELGILEKQLSHYKPHFVILLFFWNDLGVTESLHVQNGYLVLNFGDTHTAPLREWLNNHSHFYALLKRCWYNLRSPTTHTVSDSTVPQTDIDVALDFIFRMKQLCIQHHTPFVAVLLPVDGIYPGNTTMQVCRETMINEMKKHDISYRDWTLIVPREGPEQYIFKHDYHWNERGNAYFSRFLIQIIDDFLRELQG